MTTAISKCNFSTSLSIIITIYSYNAFSNYLNNLLLKIKIFQDYEVLSNYLSIILAIPIIFLISLFILKRIRQILSADLDKQILGIIIDKILGTIYGIIFSYFVFSTIIFLLNKFSFQDLNYWLMNNSEILNTINNVNEEYIYKFTFEEIEKI